MQHGAQKKEVALAELLQIERSGAAGADAALRLFFRDAQHPQAPGRRQRQRPAAPRRTACARPYPRLLRVRVLASARAYLLTAPYSVIPTLGMRLFVPLLSGIPTLISRLSVLHYRLLLPLFRGDPYP